MAAEKVIGVIPARYGSTRFPGKPLANIAGRSLLARVYSQAAHARMLSEVIVATDDERILAHCRKHNLIAEMTSPHQRSGTDRVGEIAQAHPAHAHAQAQE